MLLKDYFPYLDDDGAGHFQLGRGWDFESSKEDSWQLKYHEPWNQQRFNPSEPFIARQQTGFDGGLEVAFQMPDPSKVAVLSAPVCSGASIAFTEASDAPGPGNREVLYTTRAASRLSAWPEVGDLTLPHGARRGRGTLWLGDASHWPLSPGDDDRGVVASRPEEEAMWCPRQESNLRPFA